MSWLSACRRPPAIAASEFAHLALGVIAERKAQHAQLFPRRGEQKIALVARRVAGAKQRAAGGAVVARRDVVAGGQYVGAKIAGGVEQIGEFDELVASDARHRRFAIGVAFAKPSITFSRKRAS